MNDYIIQAKGLHKFYNNGEKELHVLKGIDLKVERAKTLGIYGPSGAGKSTLLHILGGLDSPDMGSVILGDKDLSGLSDAERARLLNKEIGFVFQFYHLLGEFTCLENVMMPVVIRNGNIPLARKEAINLLERLGLSDRIIHRPSELSGGEQQRVAIARALINKPSIVFCDEPTGNLDSKMGETIKELLKELNKEFGVTIVVVSHQKDLLDFTDKVIHIKDGIIEN